MTATAREEEASAIRDLIQRGGPVIEEPEPGDGQSSLGKRLHAGSSAAAHRRAKLEAQLRAEGRLHVIADSHFPRSSGDVRYVVCTCGWTDSDSPTDRAMAEAMRVHRQSVGADGSFRRDRSGPVERVAPAHRAGDDPDAGDDYADDDAA